MLTRRSTSLRSLLLLLAVAIAGCAGKIDDPAEYMAWLNDPANGLVKTRSINGVKISAKYLPPEYRAYLEAEAAPRDGALRRSALERAESTLGFLLSVAYDEGSGKKGDVMMKGVGGLAEFSERAMALNFDMKEQVTLRADGRLYKPVLVTFDNDYGLSPSRNIVLLFLDEEQKQRLLDAKVLDLTFEDNVFETGINHFVFSGEDLRQRIPLSF